MLFAIMQNQQRREEEELRTMRADIIERSDNERGKSVAHKKGVIWPPEHKALFTADQITPNDHSGQDKDIKTAAPVSVFRTYYLFF